MTWIHKHWGEDFIAAAKKKIQEMLSLFIHDSLKLVLTYPLR